MCQLTLQHTGVERRNEWIGSKQEIHCVYRDQLDGIQTGISHQYFGGRRHCSVQL